ncbi:MAG: TrmH family RNA methyltransferase, partial [Nitriliruptoraceae bacterium]
MAGRQPVRELLRSEQPVTEVVLAAGSDASEVLDEIARLAAERGVALSRVEDRAELDRVADGLVHQGVVAWAPALPTVGVDALVDRAAARGEAPLLVALDHVTDPHNLGSIARTAEAVGAHGLVLPSRRAASVTPAAEKAAAGAFAHLPVAVVANLNRALASLGERGVWALGLDGEAEAELGDHPLAGEPVVLVVGA